MTLLFRRRNFAANWTEVLFVNASNLDYNALGQVKQIAPGNTALITYADYGDGDPWGGAAPSFRMWRILTSRDSAPLGDVRCGCMERLWMRRCPIPPACFTTNGV